MASSRAQEIRVGVISVVALAILIGGILWGKAAGLGVENRSVNILFQNASGVEIGSPVMYRGVRKGAVSAIAVGPDGVRVTALVESSVPLREDAVASLQMLELMGGKKIEILAGHSTSPLPAGAEIPGRVEGDISALLASVGDITADVRRMMARVDSSLVVVNAMVTSPEFRRNIESTLENAQVASRDAREMIEENRGAIRQVVGNVNALAADVRQFVMRTEGTLDRTIATADSAVGDARQTLRVADATIRDADRLVVRIDSLTADITKREGVVGRLIYDKELADQLVGTLTSARELVEQIKRNGFNLNIGLGRKP